MDSKLHLLPKTSRTVQPNGFQTSPTEDLRYPGWAAPVEDGRLFTDYRSRCEKNIPVEKQEKSRLWMQRNADKMIMLSRESQASSAGMNYAFDPSIVPPAEMVSDCQKYECTLKLTEEPNGIGMIRENTDVPVLFGTFEVPKSIYGAPKPNLQITTKYEGGRNSRR